MLLITTAGAIVIIILSLKAKKWETTTSAMAVIAAILAIWSSLSVTWQQEDAIQPQIALYIDDTSHKFFYSLIIINRGGSPAYNVKLDWINIIKDFDGKIPRFTDFEDTFDFDYLPTGLTYSRFLIGADDFRKLIDLSNEPLIFEGVISYSESLTSKLRIRQEVKLSLEPFKRKVNVLNDQMDFYFENKKMTPHLKSISDSLKNISKTISKNEKNSS